MILSYIGMLLIILGWLIQFLSKDKAIKIGFVLVYAIGVLFLVVDGFMKELTFLAILNLVSFLTAFAVFVKFRK
jgi:hypothetical protein